MAQSVQKLEGQNLEIVLNVFHDSSRGATANINSVRNLLPGNQRNNVSRVNQVLSDYLQMTYDTRILLTDMPADDPDRLTDPARFNYFHAREVSADNFGSGGNLVRVYRPIAMAGVGGTATHLIHREDLITVTWDGTQNSNAISILVGIPDRFR